MSPSPAVSRRRFLTLDGGAPADPPRDEGGHWVRLHRRIMACRFEVVLPGERPESLAPARTALNLADRLEARLSVFRDRSDISEVNRAAAAAPVEVHPDVFAVLRQAAGLHAATDGAFDVTSAPLSRCWGFLRREGRIPSDEAIACARAAVGMPFVALDDERGTVSFGRPDVELNLGAIGKGYALDRMAAKLRRLGVTDALISAGGSSIAAIGADRGGWPVDLMPRLASARVARVRLRDAAMATSGAGEQFVIEGGRRYGHVIDPRTGWPARGPRSATVIARDAASADALSTAFLVAGPALAAGYCAAHPDTLAILTLEEGEGTLMFGSCAGCAIE